MITSVVVDPSETFAYIGMINGQIYKLNIDQIQRDLKFGNCQDVPLNTKIFNGHL